MRATTRQIAYDRVEYSVASKAAQVAADHPRSFRRDRVSTILGAIRRPYRCASRARLGIARR
jgi:hypothetical protein